MTEIEVIHYNNTNTEQEFKFQDALAYLAWNEF